MIWASDRYTKGESPTASRSVASPTSDESAGIVGLAHQLSVWPLSANRGPLATAPSRHLGSEPDPMCRMSLHLSFYGQI